MKTATLAAFLALLTWGAAAADDVRVIGVPATDIVYDQGTKRLYATVPGTGGSRANSVTAIDPVAGVVGSSVFVGSEPGKIAMASGERALWIALDGSGAVRRFDLATQTADLQFPIGAGLSVRDMASVPGNPDAVAVVRANRSVSPSNVDTTVYVSGRPLPKAAAAGDSIAFGLYGSRLYGYTSSVSSWDLTTLEVRPDGLERTNYVGGVVVGNLTIQYANGLLYADNGRVLDPEARQQVGQFPGIGYGTTMCVDPSVGRAFCLVDGVLKAFDLHTFAEVGSMQVREARAGAARIARWGADGLACCTHDGKVVLIRTSLVPPRRAPVDLVVTRTALPAPLRSGQAASYTITVRNSAATLATGVFLTDDIGKDLTVMEEKASQGSATAVDGVVRADLGDLPAGAKATVRVVVQPMKEGAFAPVAIARANETDLNPADNAARDRVQPGSTVAAAASGVDLTGEWISAGQIIRGAGVELRATVEGVFRVKNIGTTAAPPTKVRFYLAYTFGPFLDEDLIQEVDVPALGPGRAFDARVHAKLAQGDSATGDVLTALVDATNLAADINRDNNRIHSKPIP